MSNKIIIEMYDSMRDIESETIKRKAYTISILL